MTSEYLSRLQFALTASFHFIFPPISMGLGVLLVWMGWRYLRTGDPVWRQSSFFWVRVYGLVFALGIATGIVQEFAFGMNWSQYSRFVGNVFGSLLAAEGVFAFFLEGGFAQKFLRVGIVRESAFALRAITRFMAILRRFHPANGDVETGHPVPPAIELLA